jgi:restriction system protein
MRIALGVPQFSANADVNILLDPPPSPSARASRAPHPMLTGVATALYLLVGGSAAAAALWIWRRTRAAEVETPASAPNHQRMNAREFEQLVGEAFQLQGYQPIDSGRGDQLVLRRERETVLVECRHWQAAKVGVEAVDALRRAMAGRGAGGGFLVTSGRFARDAIALAAGCNVRLVDGAALTGLLDKARSARGTK